MTIMPEMREVLLVNTESLNKGNLGKQVLELKDKIAFVLQIRITRMKETCAVSLCLESQSGVGSPVHTLQFCLRAVVRDGADLVLGPFQKTVKSRSV